MDAVTKAVTSKPTPQPPPPKVEVKIEPEKRRLVSIKPSEAKAVVSVNGKEHKVIYHTKDGSPMIGLPGEGSVPVESWLAGQANLKGLQGA